MSFPISITWSGGAPPVGGFQQMAQAASQLDQALATSASKFDQFGSTISQLESPLSSVGSSMGELSSNMQGLDSSLSSSAGGMESFAGSTETANTAISETGGFITEASSGMGELSSATGETGTAMTGLSDTTGTFNTTISETGGFVTEAGTGMTTMGTAATDSGTAMTELNTATTDTNTALGESVTALGDVVPGLQDTATGSADSAQGFSDLAPKVDETNAALDSSSGLLSGVAPLLADTGTNAGEAATTTGDFSGAMAGLGDALGPVNGGLTSTNTLVGDVGGSADTTAGQTSGLQDSMSKLAFGLTTVVASGMSLIGAFTNIRDAGFKVEASNQRVEKATIAVDKAVFGLSKMIQKLATDSEAPIKGMGALQTAFADFQRLLAAGITSGPQYTTALNNLKAAADGLEGSTTKDNNAIKAFQIAVDSAAPKVAKLDLEQRKNQKTLENQAKAFVDAGLQVAAFAGGIGSTVQTITTMGTAAGTVKAALAGLGTTLSTSVLPALGAIAVPVGIAVGAFAAFVGATLLIRQNIKVFDDLGVKIGQVFPEMKGFLEAARQGFINMSDGINTAIGHLLSGIDSLSGGTTNMSKQWSDWTGTLPKGNGQIGSAGKAVAELGGSIMGTGEKAKEGFNKFKILSDGTLKLSNGATVAAGSWRGLDGATVEYVKSAAKLPPAVQAQTDSLNAATTAQDAMGAAADATGVVIRKQSANYSELSNAQKLSADATSEVFNTLGEEAEARYKSFLVARQYLTVIEGITPAAGLSMAAITGMGQAHMEETQKRFESVASAAKYIETQDETFLTVKRTDAEILAYAEQLKKASKETDKGAESTAKYAKELETLNQTLADNAAELAFYANAANMANRIQLEFNLGVQDAELKLNKRTFALARGSGELERNIELLNEGKLLEVAYGEGVLAAGNAIVKKSEALATAIGTYDETNRLIEEENLLLLDMQTGYQEAKTAVQAHQEALAKSIGGLHAWNEEGIRSKETALQMVQGYVDSQQALIDLAKEAAHATGEIASLREQLADSGQATIRFNQGLVEGRRSALEWAVGLARAAGEALGFRAEVLSVADDVGLAMQDMSHLSTEAIQNIIEVAAGIPEAFEETLDGLESFKDNFISILTEAGEEGVVNVMENIDKLEEDLNVRFSEPLKEKLKLEADRELVMNDINTLMGALATSLSNNPLKIEADTLPAQGAIQALIQKIDQAGAAGAHLQPLRQALVSLSQVDMTNIHEFAPALARVVQEAKAAGQPFDGLMAKFQELGPLAQMSASELDSVSAAFKTMGLSLDTTTGKITDSTGKVVGEWGKWGVGAKGAEQDVGAAMGGIGRSGDIARDAWARDMQIMFFAVDKFGQHAQVMAKTVSGAYSNLATNTHASLSTMAQGFQIILAAQTRLASDSQKMATTVSGSFSNMAKNTRASMSTMASGFQIIIAAFVRTTSESQRMASAVSSSMRSAASSAASFGSGMQSSMNRASSAMQQATSRANSLRSAINSLKSKTITITTVYVTRRITRYAAAGGAFITESPTNVGPLNVSEFGQRELVTVTPLEGAGRQPVKGLSDLVGKEGEKKGRRAMAAEEERKPSKAKEVVMMRETPIVIQVDGREIARVVNKRIFEESDALV